MRDDMRESYRGANPDADVALVEWYGRNPITPQGWERLRRLNPEYYKVKVAAQ